YKYFVRLGTLYFIFKNQNLFNFLYFEQYFYISILMIFNSLQTLDITIVIDRQNVSILCLLSE
ncbi:hypothetical protein, partial [Staphylococcus aureus]|uniref:hypothetical protein n=1 Tax=Staphylococcus aureus TaxID=1280 RepID=UPI00193BA9DF